MDGTFSPPEHFEPHLQGVQSSLRVLYWLLFGLSTLTFVLLCADDVDFLADIQELEGVKLLQQ